MRTIAAFGIVCTLVACSANSNSVSSGSLGGSSSTGVTGGTSNLGGVPATGGASALPGGAATSGGKVSTGGSAASGGALATGGNLSTGGAKAMGGGVTTGGNATTGGAKATGGAAAGGALSTGGSAATGGTKSTGGAATGGNATGGNVGTGGSKATGGSNGQLGCTSSDASYKLVWSDEFNGSAGSAVDSSKWTYDVGNSNGWGNSELEYYTSGNANAAMDGTGNLVITAKQQSMNGMNYTSARLKTLGLASWTYGRIESRIKIPKGQGLWPAFWMLGTDINSNQWPACGEIDVFENVGKEPNIVHFSMHGPGYSGASGPTAQTSLSAPVGDAFHIFAIEWEQNVIRWYLDGELVSTKTPSNIPSGANWVFAHSFFILLNLAVGGTWPGNPDSTTVFPAQMLVDYVRVCRR